MVICGEGAQAAMLSANGLPLLVPPHPGMRVCGEVTVERGKFKCITVLSGNFTQRQSHTAQAISFIINQIISPLCYAVTLEYQAFVSHVRQVFFVVGPVLSCSTPRI